MLGFPKEITGYRLTAMVFCSQKTRAANGRPYDNVRTGDSPVGAAIRRQPTFTV